MRGVDRLQRGEVAAAAIHFHGADVSANAAGDANISALRALPGLHDAVLVGVARREQGLVLAPGNPKNLQSLPDVLVSGHHGEIRKWRKRRALELTLSRRPELLAGAELDMEEQEILRALMEEQKGAAHGRD